MKFCQDTSRNYGCETYRQLVGQTDMVLTLTIIHSLYESCVCVCVCVMHAHVQPNQLTNNSNPSKKLN
jgi:hypothetical protein